MEKLLDASYKRDYDNFMEKLKECCQARGSKLGRIPTFGGQPLDLYALYNTVTSFGGIAVVTEKKKWDQVFLALGFPPCTNAAFALKQHYSRYLEAFEKIYFLGEEADDATSPSDSLRPFPQITRYRRMNQLPKITSVGEPMVQNFNQLKFSLQSGYPNEIDFALNICSLLSNVTNSIFNLAKCPQVLSLVLGHIGIWCKDDSHVDELCIQWHSENGEKDYFKFWKCSLTNNVSEEVLKESSLGLLQSIESSDDDTSKFFAGPRIKEFESNKSPEFTRTSQIATILYNFSFEPLNAMFMCHHDAFKRFLLLAGSCKHSLIQRTALDTLDNIADYLMIGRREDPFNQQFLRILHGYFKSENKVQRVRAQSVLAKLASSEDNRDILVDLLSKEVYGSLVETLYLPDICLLLYALDALYYLSGLCEETADSIVNIHGSVRVLISLSTVRAESFGNQAIEGYRIIENKSSIFTPKNQMWLKQQHQKAMANRATHPGLMQLHPGQRPSGPPLHRPIIPPHIVRQAGPPIGSYGVPYFHVRGLSQRMPNTGSKGPPGLAPIRPPTVSMAPNGIPLQVIPPMLPQRMPINSIGHYVIPPRQMPPVVVSSNGISPSLTKEITPPMLNMSKNIQDPSQKSAFKKPQQQELKQNSPAPINEEEMIEFESDVFVSHWMSGFYEPHPTNQVTTSFIYHDYTNICKDLQRSDIVSKEVFVSMIRAILPPSRVRFEDLKEDCILHGIQRRQVPLQVHSKIPKSLYQQLVASGQLKPQVNKPPQTMTSQATSQLPSIGHQLSTPTDTYTSILGNNKLSNSTECRVMIEKLKKEIQGHFMHFHAQRQYIQTIQAQAQMIQKQSSQPPAENVVKEIQLRIQGHYQQMQMHFQKLQQLNNLSEEVQSKLKSFEGKTESPVANGIDLKAPFITPTRLNGQPITVPATVPVLSEHEVNIEHGILSSSLNMMQIPGSSPKKAKSSRGKGKKSGKASPRRVNGQDSPSQQIFLNQFPVNGSPLPFHHPFPSATPISQLSVSNHQPSKQSLTSPTPSSSQPNSIALKNPFGHFPHTEALKTLYMNNIRSANESSDPTSPNVSLSPKLNGRPTHNLGNPANDNQSMSNTTPSMPQNLSKVPQINVNDDKLTTENIANGVTNEVTSKCNGDIVSHDAIPQRGFAQTLTNGDATHEEKSKITDLHLDMNPISNKRKLNGDISPVSEKKLKLGLSFSPNGGTNLDDEIIVGRVSILKDDQKQDSDYSTKENKVNGDKQSQPIRVNNDDFSSKENIDNSINVHKEKQFSTVDERVEQSSKVEANENICKEKVPCPNKTLNGREHKLTLDDCKRDGVSAIGKSPEDLRPQHSTNNLFLKLTEEISKTPELTPSSASPATSERKSNSSSNNTPSELKVEGERTFLLLHGTQKLDGVFPCQWERCSKSPFGSALDLLNHMVETHAPVEGKMSRCKVKHCSSSHKPRGALICHFKEKHCQIATPDDLQKHQDFRIEDESPVTRSIRYTATLILRNLIRKSTSGRDILLAYEHDFAMLAISSSEAMTAALDSLDELNASLRSDEEDTTGSVEENDDNSETMVGWKEQSSVGTPDVS